MDLRSQQIKDTYGNLLTVGTSAGSPTTGTVENGQGSDITSLTVNGTLNATDVSATSLSGYGYDISGMPNIRVNMFSPTSLTNSTNNYVGFSGYFRGPSVDGGQPSQTFELVNSGQATSTGARVHVKEPGQYLFNVYAKISGLHNGTEVLINITESTSSSGTMSSAKGIVQHTYSHNAMTAIATGTIFLYNNNTNNYYSFYINPSSHTPTLEFAELQIIRLSPV